MCQQRNILFIKMFAISLNCMQSQLTIFGSQNVVETLLFIVLRMFPKQRFAFHENRICSFLGCT